MKVAILSWGDVIEDFLDTLGLDLEAYATRMSGGWLFGYLDALRRVGVDGCVVVVSVRVRRTTRLVNPATGAATLALPARAGYRLLRRTGHAGWAGRLALPRAALAEALRAEGVTHILCQEYEYHRAGDALTVGRKLGLPVLASFQGGQPAAGPLERRLRARTIAGLDGLIVAAGGEAERVRQTYGVEPARIFRIPNPLDLELWAPQDRQAARAALGLSPGARIAICHTRIETRRKGLDVLLEAWRMVRAARSGAGAGAGADLALHLIGTGPDERALRAAIAADPVPGLRWTGYTADRAEMRRALCAADLYVSASRHEGFAVAPLEAMACGLPALLSTAPGSAEIVPQGEADGGLIVPAGDAAALAAALGGLMDDPDRMRRMGTAARRRSEAFGLDAVGAQLAAALRT